MNAPHVATATRLLAGTDAGPLTLARHRAFHPLAPTLDRESLAAQAESAALVGRGGAAFPVARKLRATAPGPTTTVVVNGSESEPASRKDRVLLCSAPHLVIDGALRVAAALGTDAVTVTVHDEAAFRSLLAARAERADAGAVVIDRSSTGFVGGEATAIVARLGGGASVPDARRVPPSVAGVGGRPTFLSNVETFAQLAWLGSHGVEAFRAAGTAHEPGTSLLTVLGDASRPGVLEVAHGTPLSEVTGRPGAPVLVGGYHGAWAVDDGLTVDRAALRARGLTLGAGVLAVLPDATCPLGEVARVARWLGAQSLGRCGPCTFGLPTVADDLDALLRGDPLASSRLRRRLGLVAGRGACAHPDGAARFVASALEVFASDVEAHRARRGCGRPVLRTLPVSGVLA